MDEEAEETAPPRVKPEPTEEAPPAKRAKKPAAKPGAVKMEAPSAAPPAPVKAEKPKTDPAAPSKPPGRIKTEQEVAHARARDAKAAPYKGRALFARRLDINGVLGGTHLATYGPRAGIDGKKRYDAAFTSTPRCDGVRSSRQDNVAAGTAR